MEIKTRFIVREKGRGDIAEFEHTFQSYDEHFHQSVLTKRMKKVKWPNQDVIITESPYPLPHYEKALQQALAEQLGYTPSLQRITYNPIHSCFNSYQKIIINNKTVLYKITNMAEVATPTKDLHFIMIFSFPDLEVFLWYKQTRFH